MSGHEATAPEPSPEDPEGDEKGEDGGAAGGAGAGGFLRRHGRTLIVVVVGAIAAYAAFAGPGGGDGGSDDAGPSPSTTAAEDPGDPGTTAAVTTAPGATEVTDPAPSSTLVPPDVDADRPAVDLDTPPPADDPVEVARWWAGTYTAYVGAEPPTELVTRLADRTAPELLDELRALPPAASYDAPLAVDGVSEIDLPAGGSASGSGSGGAAGGRQMRVSVQTPVALVLYDMTLVQGSDGGWLVREAARV